MSRSKFDPAKLADLVNEESKLGGELRDKSAELNDLHQKAHDADWDSAENAKYQRLQLHHAQLSRDLEAVRQERVSYEGFEPDRARDAVQSPLARFLRKGHQGLEEGELKTHCDLDKSEYGMGGNVEGFSIRLRSPQERRAQMATRTTAAVALPREIAPRVVDDLAFFGGVAKMAQQFMTANGNEYRIPNLDAAGQEGEILSADGTAVSALDLGTFESANFVARTCSSKSINITRELVHGQRVRHRGVCRAAGRAAHGAGVEQGVHDEREQRHAGRRRGGRDGQCAHDHRDGIHVGGSDRHRVPHQQGVPRVRRGRHGRPERGDGRRHRLHGVRRRREDDSVAGGRRRSAAVAAWRLRHEGRQHGSCACGTVQRLAVGRERPHGRGCRHPPSRCCSGTSATTASAP